MPTGVVLAGGRSSRMGVDKAALPVAGVAMAARVAAAMTDAGCRPVWCQGGDPDRLGEIGLTVWPDRVQHEGPLAAIVDALRRSCDERGRSDDLVLVAACDLPGVDPATITTLLTAAADNPQAPLVVAADADGGAHLLGVWRTAAAEQLSALLDAGHRSYRSAVAALGAVAVVVDPARVDNVNTPSDLVAAQRGAGPVASPPVVASEVNVDQLAEALAEGARLFDVREPTEYAAGRVPGAVLVPLATVPGRLAEFAGDGPVYVICRSGARSMSACEWLAEQGIEAVNVAGGMIAWVASGRPYDGGAQ
jgi:molybdopterin-guanine dinucleotide biosynthesis protein A/rhodanese-related sulfurtransferase